MQHHEKLNYVEFPSQDIEQTKAFFKSAFGWSFQDYGPDYSAFDFQGLLGGFYLSDREPAPASNAALLIFYSSELEKTLARVLDAGGIISKAIFSFPGGRRFHFKEPGGNELAVWSDPE